MKRFFDIFTTIMTVVFIVGLVVSAVSSNWAALCWVIVGLLWMLGARGQELLRKDSVECLKKDYEQQLSDTRKERDLYRDKYDAKLQENYDLAQANLELAKKNEQLSEQPLGTPNHEAGVHGNIKIKKRKKSSPKVKSDVQDKTE